MADVFVKRYRGEQETRFLHPALGPILGPTKGVLIFQEQVLRIATEVAGLSWEQADHLRRGMSHFGRHEIAALQEQFVQGCTRPAPGGPGMTPATAEQLWEQILPFSGYGFNQGHATAYADVSYRCAYMKAHYPAEFLAARLQDWGGFHHPAIYMSEAVRLGIPVRPPHVNYSGTKFTLAVERPGYAEKPGFSEKPGFLGAQPTREEKPGFSQKPGFLGALYMGLGQVRDLRDSAAEAIAAERTRAGGRGPYADLRDLLARVDLQPKELDHLIRCGALDGLGEAGSRSELLAEAELLRRRGGIEQLAFDFARPQPPAETMARRWEWEQELLGLPVSALGDPLALVRDRAPAPRIAGRGNGYTQQAAPHGRRPPPRLDRRAGLLPGRRRTVRVRPHAEGHAQPRALEAASCARALDRRRVRRGMVSGRAGLARARALMQSGASGNSKCR